MADMSVEIAMSGVYNRELKPWSDAIPMLVFRFTPTEDQREELGLPHSFNFAVTAGSREYRMIRDAVKEMEVKIAIRSKDGCK